MSRLLTIAVTFHWSAVFSLLTILLIFPGKGDPIGTSLLGTTLAPLPEGQSKLVIMAFALVFALCAVLFVWALVTAIWADRDADSQNADVTEKAFAAASVAMTIVLAYGVARSQSGLIPVMAMNYAALIASFVALRFDRPAASKSKQALADDLKAKAMEASYSSLLARLVPASVESQMEGR